MVVGIPRLPRRRGAAGEHAGEIADERAHRQVDLACADGRVGEEEVGVGRALRDPGVAGDVEHRRERVARLRPVQHARRDGERVGDLREAEGPLAGMDRVREQAAGGDEEGLPDRRGERRDLRLERRAASARSLQPGKRLERLQEVEVEAGAVVRALDARGGHRMPAVAGMVEKEQPLAEIVLAGRDVAHGEQSVGIAEGAELPDDRARRGQVGLHRRRVARVAVVARQQLDGHEAVVVERRAQAVEAGRQHAARAELVRHRIAQAPHVPEVARLMADAVGDPDRIAPIRPLLARVAVVGVGLRVEGDAAAADAVEALGGAVVAGEHVLEVEGGAAVVGRRASHVDGADDIFHHQVDVAVAVEMIAAHAVQAGGQMVAGEVEPAVPPNDGMSVRQRLFGQRDIERAGGVADDVDRDLARAHAPHVIDEAEARLAFPAVEADGPAPRHLVNRFVQCGTDGFVIEAHARVLKVVDFGVEPEDVRRTRHVLARPGQGRNAARPHVEVDAGEDAGFRPERLRGCAALPSPGVVLGGVAGQQRERRMRQIEILDVLDGPGAARRVRLPAIQFRHLPGSAGVQGEWRAADARTLERDDQPRLLDRVVFDRRADEVRDDEHLVRALAQKRRHVVFIDLDHRLAERGGAGVHEAAVHVKLVLRVGEDAQPRARRRGLQLDRAARGDVLVGMGLGRPDPACDSFG